MFLLFSIGKPYENVFLNRKAIEKPSENRWKTLRKSHHFPLSLQEAKNSSGIVELDFLLQAPFETTGKTATTRDQRKTNGKGFCFVRTRKASLGTREKGLCFGLVWLTTLLVWFSGDFCWTLKAISGLRFFWFELLKQNKGKQIKDEDQIG